MKKKIEINLKIVKTKKHHKHEVRKMLKQMSDELCSMGDRPPMRIRANKSYIVMLNGAIIGTFSLSKANGAEWRAFYRFYIKERYRGIGIGKLIMSKAEEMVGQIEGLYLNVYNKNEGAMKLYSKMGYEEYERQGIYIYMKKELVSNESK